MATPRDNAPWIWTTWLTPVLAGDAQCKWAAHFKARNQYEKQPSDFNLAKWSAEHNELVQWRAAQLKAEGWKVRIENQNKFTVKGSMATVTGKLDIVAQRGNELLFSDGKTGQQKNKDWWQVLTYLFLFPMAFADFCAGKTLAGEVVYKDHQIVPVPFADLAERKDAIIALIREIGSEDAPEPVPSQSECEWCDITKADCHVRFGEGDAVSVFTSEF